MLHSFTNYLRLYIHFFSINHNFFSITNLSYANIVCRTSHAVRGEKYFPNIHQVCQHKNFTLMRTQKLCLHDE